MKKCFEIIIFLTILAIINSENLECEDFYGIAKREDCFKFNSKDESEKNSVCCYFFLEKSDLSVAQCALIEKDDKDVVIRNSIDGYKQGGFTTVILECEPEPDSNSYSYYLQLNILFLLLILL